MVNVGPETRPRTTTLPRAFRSDEVADSKDLLRAVRCVIPKSGRSVKVTYLGIRSAHERVWLVEQKPIWLPQAYLTKGDLEPARGNLHVCKFLRDLTIIQIRTVTAEWAIFVLSAVARRTCYIARKEGRKARTRRRERKKEGTATEREGKRVKLTTVSSLELIQESVSCCLLRPLLTTLTNQILQLKSSGPKTPYKNPVHKEPLDIDAEVLSSKSLPHLYEEGLVEGIAPPSYLSSV